MSWKLFSEEKPQINQWIYIKKGQEIEINKVREPIDDPAHYEKFHCEGCGLNDYIRMYDIRTCAHNNLEWAPISKQRFIKICECCGIEKFNHACGKESHPACAKYNEAEKEERTFVVERRRLIGAILFWWILGIFTVVILVFISGAADYFGLYIKSKLYTKVGKPIINDVSKEMQDIIKVIKVPLEPERKKDELSTRN